MLRFLRLALAVPFLLVGSLLGLAGIGLVTAESEMGEGIVALVVALGCFYVGYKLLPRSGVGTSRAPVVTNDRFPELTKKEILRLASQIAGTKDLHVARLAIAVMAIMDLEILLIAAKQKPSKMEYARLARVAANEREKWMAKEGMFEGLDVRSSESYKTPIQTVFNRYKHQRISVLKMQSDGRLSHSPTYRELIAVADLLDRKSDNVNRDVLVQCLNVSDAPSPSSRNSDLEEAIAGVRRSLREARARHDHEEVAIHQHQLQHLIAQR